MNGRSRLGKRATEGGWGRDNGVGDWPRMGVESKLWGLDWTFSRLTEAAGDGWGRGGGFHTSNQGGGGTRSSWQQVQSLVELYKRYTKGKEV